MSLNSNCFYCCTILWLLGKIDTLWGNTLLYCLQWFFFFFFFLWNVCLFFSQPLCCCVRVSEGLAVVWIVLSLSSSFTVQQACPLFVLLSSSLTHTPLFSALSLTGIKRPTGGWKMWVEKHELFSKNWYVGLSFSTNKTSNKMLCQLQLQSCSGVTGE